MNSPEQTKIETLEFDMRLLKLRVENLMQFVTKLPKPPVRPAAGHLSIADVARANGVMHKTVRRYAGIFGELKQYERRTESRRIYFRRGDYEKFVREIGRTAEDRAIEAEKAARPISKRSKTR